MAQASSQTIRLRADEVSRSAMIDANIGSVPTAWARAATGFEVGLAAGGFLVDVGNLASVTLEATRYDNRDAARVLSKTLALADLDNTLTEDAWKDGTKEHARFRFSSAEMNLLTTGISTRDLWIVISALTTEGDPIVFGTGKLTINDPGAFLSAAMPPETPGAYITIDQADTRYAPAGSAGVATAITSVGDGAAGSLEAVPTVALVVPVYRTIDVNDRIQIWKLTASTAATSVDGDGNPDAQRPTDYNQSTNAKVWFRKL